MATTFKTFLNNDVISSRTLLNEAIPLTGTIVSGTYGALGSEKNVKNYSHGMFQSVFDYPYLSSSANHLMDLTFGYAADSALSNSSGKVQQEKKINIYNQMAQVLMGYDTDGNIRQFDEDGDLSGGRKMKACMFMNFSRLLTKDEIKKGSFVMNVGMGDLSHGNPTTGSVKVAKVYDYNANNEYRINSPAGEYGILYVSGGMSSSVVFADGTHLIESGSSLTSSYGSGVGNANEFNRVRPCGLIFYQAGIVALSASLFQRGTGSATGHGVLDDSTFNTSGDPLWTGTHDLSSSMASSSIEVLADGLRHRIRDIKFNNTTELNSTIYFCRVNNNDFNYSSNPTYLSSSKIVVKQTTSDEPVSYITTIGMYSSDNELLACAKLSEPLKKTPSNEFTLRVRLDY